MKIAAITIKGTEFIYKASTAHKVPKSSGADIVDALNRAGFRLRPGEVWHLYDIDRYSGAYDIASCQGFRVYRGRVSEYR